MDLETIKKFDNSWWLRYLETTTVFDAKGIEEQFNWLIKQVEHYEAVKGELEEKISEINKRIDRRSGVNFHNETKKIESLHGEALVYEKVLEMLHM